MDKRKSVVPFLLEHGNSNPVSFHMPGHKGSWLYRENGYGEILDAYIDYRQNPENEMIQKENIKVLEDLLQNMKKKDKELMMRRFYYMQSTRQIALAMNMTENAVDSKLSRIRKKVKGHFEKEMKR